MYEKQKCRWRHLAEANFFQHRENVGVMPKLFGQRAEELELTFSLEQALIDGSLEAVAVAGGAKPLAVEQREAGVEEDADDPPQKVGLAQDSLAFVDEGRDVALGRLFVLKHFAQLAEIVLQGVEGVTETAVEAVLEIAVGKLEREVDLVLRLHASANDGVAVEASHDVPELGDERDQQTAAVSPDQEAARHGDVFERAASLYHRHQQEGQISECLPEFVELGRTVGQGRPNDRGPAGHVAINFEDGVAEQTIRRRVCRSPRQ